MRARRIPEGCLRQMTRTAGRGCQPPLRATLALKVELLERLVEEVHSSAVMFETQVYEFIHQQHAIDGRTATPDQ